MNASRRRAVSRVSRLARAAAVSVKGLQRQPGAPATPRAPEGADRTALVRRPMSTPLGQSSLGDRGQARAAGAGRDLGIPAAMTLFDGDRCPACGGPIERAETGRPATYCSDLCRKRASRSEGAGHVTKLEVAPTSTPTPEPANSLRKPAAPKDLAAIASGIPTPADSFGLARAYAEVRGGGFGVVFGLDAGRRHEPVGPVFKAPRQAIELSELLNGRLAA